MKINLSIVATSTLLILSFGGCQEDYKWSTNNTSPLEGKYETRDKSLDLSRKDQIEVAKVVTQNYLYTHKVAGVSVSIIFDDNMTSNFAYGCAKLTTEKELNGYLTYESGHTENCEIPLSTDYRFKLGSLTKTAIARTILDIDDDSSYDFDLDDPVTKHLPTNITELGDLSGITINHLLHHSSGLPEIDYKPRTVEDIIATALQNKRIFKPGQMYRYNNLGYVILGQVIKYVTKADSWEGEVLKRINSTLGENNSFILPEENNPNWIDTTDTSWMVGKEGTLTKGDNMLVTGYNLDTNGNGFLNMIDSPSADIANAAGSSIATLEDAARWMRAISTNSNKLLSDDYFKNRVWEVSTDSYMDIYELHLDWNMGPGIGFNQTHNALFHAGLFNGYACYAVYSKNEKATIAACMNTKGSIGDLPYNILSEMYPYRKAYLPTTTTETSH